MHSPPKSTPTHASTSKKSSPRCLRPPSTKGVLFHSPPRTILSARLAAQKVLAELELPETAGFTDLAHCSARDVTLYRPKPRSSLGRSLGLIRTPDDVLLLEAGVKPVAPGRMLSAASSTSNRCMVEDAISESFSGLSSMGDECTTPRKPPTPNGGTTTELVMSPTNSPQMHSQATRNWGDPAKLVIGRQAPKRARSNSNFYG
ncbi:hypothetical protein AB1Y20_017906 [Prymnesium parvum]|uniref:Uncharacterized protein n=1 Tax=Prymnesium parvum TaxID=97485 RepID=A0AB34JNT7_PRYPA